MDWLDLLAVPSPMFFFNTVLAFWILLFFLFFFFLIPDFSNLRILFVFLVNPIKVCQFVDLFKEPTFVFFDIFSILCFAYLCSNLYFILLSVCLWFTLLFFSSFLKWNIRFLTWNIFNMHVYNYNFSPAIIPIRKFCCVVFSC